MALYGGKTPAQLTLSDAIMTGFRMVTQVNFVVPILVIGVVVNLIVLAAFVPVFVGVLTPSTTESSTLLTGAIITSLIGGLIGAILGGLLLNLYGQVWATMASVGEAPTMQATVTRIGERWMSVLGAGLITGAIAIAIILVGTLLSVLLGTLGILTFIVMVVAAIYVGARLSLSGWLAADGSAAMVAVQTSWAMTQSKLLLVIGWTIAFALVFGIVGAVLDAILGIIPLVGHALASTAEVAFGYGAGVSLYRKVKGS